MKKAQPADFPSFEAEMLQKWHDDDTFAQSLRQRSSAKRWSFYDGPPFANGLPHFGHSLVTSIKDSLGRYHTMKGEYVERRNGWDCHGLPVEFAIEKEFKVSGKKQILELGLERFNQACRASVFKYKGDWEAFFRRIGRWTDAEHAYATIDRDYTESVWWAFSEVAKKGLLYRGYKSMPYCPRCETPLSNFELNEGYQDDVSDPSVFVKFKLRDKDDTSLLVWTTTPWTLPANAAVAVKQGADYVTIELKDTGDSWHTGERLIIARDRVSELSLRNADYEVVDQHKGEDLEGLLYEPLYSWPPDLLSDSDRQHGWKVYLDDSVSLEDGSGLLHVAPLYGETDLNLGQANSLPMLRSVDSSGHIDSVVGQIDGLASIAGVFFKDADPHITADLQSKDNIFAAETFSHTYPFCYRCESPLLYFAITTWFIRVSAIKDELMTTAAEINWTPAHIKDGRFGKWLEGARDWAISRNRYWGAPMPIWINEQDENDYIIVGSLDELVELAGLSGKPEDLHRPGIDQVTFVRDGKTYRRVDEVFDCWFESGAMPVAQQHYPFENGDVFESSFPADYIGEGLDQTRLWFYVQHVIATILFNRPAYKHVLVNGMIMAADGQKLSKRLKNYPPVDEVFASEGADTLRFYLLSNDQALSADYMRFNRDAMKDIQRNVFMTLWNVYSFMTTYAEIDDWTPSGKLDRPVSDNVLDRWLLARLNQTIAEMTTSADNFEIAKALRPLRALIDDLSNWYVRRSRRRFWKSEDDSDKAAAYSTLHYSLCRIAQLLGPWSPFLADKLWSELTLGMDEASSVHLSDWPIAGDYSAELLTQMESARAIIVQGLGARAEAKIKVRQPLASLSYKSPVKLVEFHYIMADELNVKSIYGESGGLEVALDCNLTDELIREGLVRDLIRQVQSLRKESGLEVADRIILSITSDNDQLSRATLEHAETIKSETLATSIEPAAAVGAYVKRVMLGGYDVDLAVAKV